MGGSSGRKAAAGSAVRRRSEEGSRGAQSLRQQSGGGGNIGRRPDPVDGLRLRRCREGGSVAGGPADPKATASNTVGEHKKTEGVRRVIGGEAPVDRSMVLKEAMVAAAMTRAVVPFCARVLGNLATIL